ncbi:MAG: gamma-glutamyl-gamma-aminobutyrate hydrolase family protein [Phycisphaerae bacterium]|nr:gamma-glutamyl-gamma-aminobutyrate hydrolase family protein [Phycisphaerae bacterium]
MTSKTNSHIKIGVSMNYRVTSSGTRRAYIDSPYIDFLADWGVQPVPIAITDSYEMLDRALMGLDGVLFTGGLDLDPVLWDEPLHDKTELVHPRRQKYDFDLYKAVTARHLPIMGICLGLQMINIYHHGSLYQHLPQSPGLVDHGREHHHTSHSLTLAPESRLYTWLGEKNISVMSGHHQGVCRLGEGLLAAGIADDGVIEAIERPEYPFLIAVQWHPEKDPENPVTRAITENFLNAAASYTLRKSSLTPEP